jgi:hypothetical protein
MKNIKINKKLIRMIFTDLTAVEMGMLIQTNKEIIAVQMEKQKGNNNH